ncbi:phosphopantetheine-binding protein [Amycolatopsis acidiphila]|uniref:Acyl carrier protein n=1 Tax=Amycolatopsis acidiphila TaxID=715473 RepID=A0A558AH98_9PSEU|nr:phosphopantetheine-binding protein [Amycolatopsis acidiphila]TVT23645.1 acyl carrier protein [Amycolatopsis acidiphila]UIJ58635.1 phosphopantetheine-binding protein [Amycolatopsis acidiphila]GHG76331.1 hypothetical protein GCM10017788_41770 [Amycolatopsis acidiphila]
MDAVFVDVLRRFLPLLGEQEMTAEAPLRELGLDSMQSIELLFALEDTFSIRLPEDVLTEETFSTAGRLWRATSAAIGDGSTAAGRT